MSTGRVAAVGGGATFVLAAVAGVVGNQLPAAALWAWIVFMMVLVIGAVTAWVARRTMTHHTPPGLYSEASNPMGQAPATDRAAALQDPLLNNVPALLTILESRITAPRW